MKVAKHLIDNKADVDAKDKHGSTPLHSSAMGGNSQWIFYWVLKKYINKVHENVLNKFKIGTQNIAKILMENGANVNATNNDGDTPLHTSAKYGN